MWWIVLLIALVLLAIDAVMVTFAVMVALNGFSSLPDAPAIIYLVCTCGLIALFGLLDGLLARRLSKTHPVPLWLAGAMTTAASMVIMPILLVGLTVVLLLAFGMI